MSRVYRVDKLVKTMMVYMLFRVIVFTFIKQAGYLGLFLRTTLENVVSAI